MGRGKLSKKIVIEPHKVKAPRDRRRQQPCFMELRDLSTCYGQNPDDHDKCEQFQKALDICVDESRAVSGKGLHKPTTNYHLGRLARKLVTKK